MPRRPRIIGFGPIGHALLLPLAALIWVALSGYNLQHQLLRLIDFFFGWPGLVYCVTRIHAAHYFAMQSPVFNPISLCVVILVLHFAPRRTPAWCYVLLAAWSLVGPLLSWTLRYSLPGWTQFAGSPLLASEVAASVVAAMLLALTTRSRGVGVAMLLVAPGVLVLSDCLSSSALGTNPVTVSVVHGLVYLWHAALATILALWAAREWRSLPPDYACQSCGYDLRALATPACPECGNPRTTAASA